MPTTRTSSILFATALCFTVAALALSVVTIVASSPDAGANIGFGIAALATLEGVVALLSVHYARKSSSSTLGKGLEAAALSILILVGFQLALVLFGIVEES